MELYRIQEWHLLHAAPALSLCAPYRLQDRQVDFVLRCIRHLQQVHGNVAAGPEQQQGHAEQRPFRLVLVAYSMGGVVARDALRRLAADPNFGERRCLGVQGVARCLVVSWLCRDAAHGIAAAGK